MSRGNRENVWGKKNKKKQGMIINSLKQRESKLRQCLEETVEMCAENHRNWQT